MIRINSLIAFLFFFLVCPGYSQEDHRIDSLENLLKSASPEEKVNLFCEISELYWQRSYDTSLIMAIHAHELAGTVNDPALTATSLYMIGNAYYLLGDFPRSMDYYLQALEIREEIGDSSDLASSYNNIGAVYLHMEDDRKALEYFKRSEVLFRALKKDRQLFPILNNIGAVYVENDLPDTALVYFNRAYRIAERSGDKVNLSIALANLGETTLAMGLYQQSEDYENRALEISSSIGDKGMMATIKTNLGKISMQRNDLPGALASFRESLVLAMEINSLPLLQENYRNLSEYYLKKGEDKMALQFYKRYAAVKDSLMSQERLTKIKELELKFNARNLQQEIELLRKDNEIRRLRQTRLKYGFVLLVILLLALGMLFLMYYQRNRLKKETNRMLEEKNRELEKANKQLQESEKHLIELNSTKDKFFSIIGHDLRNPLNALLGFSELISGNSKDYSMKEIRRYSKIINEAARNIHLLLENLLEWSRSQSGSIEFKPQEKKLNPIILDIVGIFKILAGKKKISIETDLNGDATVFADQNLLSTILRNLISNAVKFTPKEGSIRVSSKKTDGGISISVKDSGVGMTESQQEKLFSLAYGPSTPGTADERGTGLGLILCKEFVDRHKGSIKVESEPGKGSTFTVFLPDRN